MCVGFYLYRPMVFPPPPIHTYNLAHSVLVSMESISENMHLQWYQLLAADNFTKWMAVVSRVHYSIIRLSHVCPSSDSGWEQS